jgi:nucleotide-binding universal stress UspA family protein
MAKPSLIQHILVLVDGTEESHRAADFSISLAGLMGSRLTVLAVVETDTLHQLLSVRILAEGEMAEFEQELEESARRQVAEVRERAMRRRVVVDEVTLQGNSEEVVPREVEARGVDLIVLGGFQSRHALRDLVARQRQQIVDHARCPVVVVK